MTPEESRESFIDSIFTPDELSHLKALGLYEEYVTGRISINTIYKHFKEEGI